MRNDVEVGSRTKSVADKSAYRIEVNSLDVLQATCRSVYTKAL